MVGLALVVRVGSKAALVGQPRLQHTDAEALNSPAWPVYKQGTIFTQLTAASQWLMLQHALRGPQPLSVLARAAHACCIEAEPWQAGSQDWRVTSLQEVETSDSPVHPTALCCRSLEWSAGWPHLGSRPLHEQGTLGSQSLQRGGARTTLKLSRDRGRCSAAEFSLSGGTELMS